MLRGEQPAPGTWRGTDRLLLLALEAYEQNVHGPCGQPMVWSGDPDAKGHYEEDAATCWACAVLEENARARESADVRDKPGVMRWVAPDQALAAAMQNPGPDQGGHAHHHFD